MLIIVDYGLGNLHSIKNMLKKAGVNAIISADPTQISQADKLILPGVGSFDYGIEHLSHSGLLEVLNKKVLIDKTPILGICLGVQLFAQTSEEGNLPGLGWIQGEVIKFRSTQMENKLKVPHMGWNDIYAKKPSKLFTAMDKEPRFYFVHSFHLHCANFDNILATAHYGYEFVAAIEQENIVGVQFHPEKSHKFGMKLLHNFATLY